MKKMFISLLLIVLIVILTTCGGGEVVVADMTFDSQLTTSSGESVSTQETTQSDEAVPSTPISVEYDPDDLASSPENASRSTIKLNGDSVTFEGAGVTVDGMLITITSAGVYEISGVLNDGQIVVDTQDEATVVLLLDGAQLTCTTSAPIYVRNAQKNCDHLSQRN